MKKRKFSVPNNKLEDFLTVKLFIIRNRVKNDRILSNNEKWRPQDKVFTNSGRYEHIFRKGINHENPTEWL